MQRPVAALICLLRHWAHGTPRRFGPTTPRKDPSPQARGTRCQCLLLLIAANGILSTAPPSDPRSID